MNFKVMTYNIRRIYHEKKGDYFYWDNRKEKVAETIMKFEPDILGLQESSWKQVCDFKKLLPDKYEVTALSFIFQDSIIYNKERFKPCLSWMLILRPLYRWAYVVKFYDKIENKKFYFCNTHLHPGALPVDEDKRVYGVNIILKSLKKYTDKYPVILTGDFNSTWYEIPYKIVNESFLHDSIVIPYNPKTSDCSAVGDTQLADVEGHIDHIFINNKFESIADWITWSIDEDQWKYTDPVGIKRFASDHLGKIIEVTYQLHKEEK